MKKKIHLLLIIVFILGLSSFKLIHDIQATTGSVRRATISSCGNISYGAHSNPLHWHIINGSGHALPSQGQWPSEEALRRDLCNDSASTSTTSPKSSNTNIDYIKVDTNQYKNTDLSPLDCSLQSDDMCQIDSLSYLRLSTINNKANFEVELEDEHASYKINNSSLKLGNNEVKIVVTAEDNSKETYTIHVVRIDNNLDIKNFKINDKDYTNIDTFETEDIDLTLELMAKADNVTLSYDSTKSLDYGDNPFIVSVSNDWGTTKEYTFNLVRLKSSNTQVKSITYIAPPNNHDCPNPLKTSNPVFSICQITPSHDLVLTIAQDHLNFNVELEHDQASYTLENHQQLTLGENNVLIHVKAENGSIVTRPIKVIYKDNNPHLNRFGLIDNQSIDFNQVYQTEKDSLSLTITPQSSTTQLTYEGNVRLDLGDNYIPIQTITEFGNESIQYIHIQRLPSSNNQVRLLLNNQPISMAYCNLNNDCYSQTIDVSNDTKSLEQLALDIKLLDENATYDINTMQLHRGINQIKVNVTAQNNKTNQMFLVVNRELPPLKTSHYLITGVLSIGFVFTSALIIYNKEYWLYH